MEKKIPDSIASLPGFMQSAVFRLPKQDRALTACF